MYVVCVKAEEVGGEGPGQLTPEGGLLVETRESCVGRVVVVLDGNKAGKWSSCLIHISGVCVCVCSRLLVRYTYPGRKYRKQKSCLNI